MPDTGALRYLLTLLEKRTGQQVAPGRLWRLEIMLKPVMRARGIETFEALIVALHNATDATLADAVVEAMLNHETFFFRDTAAFALLQGGALDAVRLARASTRRIRIWCAGCSTGQEVYSLAILFADSAVRWDGWTIELVATDISGTAIRRAQDGIYSQFEIQRGLPVKAMLRWFDQQGEAWHVKRELARSIRFRQASLLDRSPFTGRFDIILCRNVLLYFTPDRRTAAFDRIAEAIAADGYLMLGAGETIIGQTEAFAADTQLRGLYRPNPRSDRARAA